MRLFLGVQLEDPVRAACAAAARDLSAALRHASANVSVRWIAEENLHITLWFLGNVPDDRSNAIGQAVGVPWTVEGFTISLAGAGAFPPAGPLRIIWLGLDDGVERMKEIYGELASRLGALGFEAEKRPYHPHITIGRVKEASTADSRKARNVLSGWSVRPGTSQVRAVTLFQSRLSPAGARYEPLLRVPLKRC